MNETPTWKEACPNQHLDLCLKTNWEPLYLGQDWSDMVLITHSSWHPGCRIQHWPTEVSETFSEDSPMQSTLQWSNLDVTTACITMDRCFLLLVSLQLDCACHTLSLSERKKENLVGGLVWENNEGAEENHSLHLPAAPCQRSFFLPTSCHPG